ncbi:MAG: hypothetical protein NT069_07535, partial [Planctomycetota bacterium]|nr:hypothetical protein [Planctomycetota bacterium]
MNDISSLPPNLVVDAKPSGGRFPWLRLVAAFGLTAALVYPIGRTVVVGLLVGIPEREYLVATILGVLVLTGLTWNLAPRIASPRARHGVDLAVTLLWIVLGLAPLWVSASDLFGFGVAGPLFLVSTIAIVRLGWVTYDCANWRRRLTWVVCLLPFAGLFPLLIKVVGLTGGAKVQFDWRFATRIDPGSQLAVPVHDGGDPGFALEIVPRPEEDFPQYLGTDRNGVVPKVKISGDWMNHPPREVWRHDVGAGWSGFAVVGDYCFTQEQRGDKECVVCYAVADGAEQWVLADVARFESDMGGIGPRATPTFDNDLLFTVGGT